MTCSIDWDGYLDECDKRSALKRERLLLELEELKESGASVMEILAKQRQLEAALESE